LNGYNNGTTNNNRAKPKENSMFHVDNWMYMEKTRFTWTETCILRNVW